MFKKSILTVLILTACLQLNTAEEKFDSLQSLIRHGVRDFVTATFGSVEKGIVVAETIVKDLKAQDLKDEKDKAALDVLETYLDENKNRTDGVDKLKVIMRSLRLIGTIKTDADVIISKSEVVKNLIIKYDFESVRQAFLKDFNNFAEKFNKEVDDFLTYGKDEEIENMKKWSTNFKAETGVHEKLHMFLRLFIDFGDSKE